MPTNKQQAKAAENEEMGSAGHETGIEEPSEMGTAGIYATPVHPEAEEAEKAGTGKTGKAAP
jgi:hypothetical protein